MGTVQRKKTLPSQVPTGNFNQGVPEISPPSSVALSPHVTSSFALSLLYVTRTQNATLSHIDLLVYKHLQAEVAINKPRTFADACAHPSAKVLVFRGRTSPVKAVEADGMLFIKNEEAEAAAEAIRSKAMDPASEVAVASEVAPAPKPTAGSAAALNSDEPSRSLVRSSATGYPISYAAAASKPPVGPKPSAAAFLHSAASSKFSAGPKYSAPASQPAVVLAPPLKVSIEEYTESYTLAKHIHVQRVHADVHAR